MLFRSSVFVRWRIAATGLIIGIMFVLSKFGDAIDSILHTHWGKLLDIFYAMYLVGSHLFRLGPGAFGGVFKSGIPLWSAWVVIMAACVISVMLLNRRLKAREVVRG